MNAEQNDSLYELAHKSYDTWMNGDKRDVLRTFENVHKFYALYLVVTMMEIARSEGRIHLFASSFRVTLDELGWV
jgi:hypothetical protein